MGLFKTAAKVAVASAVHGRVQRRQQRRWSAQDQASATPVQEQFMEAPVSPSPVAHAPSGAVSVPTAAPVNLEARIAMLTQLGQLRDAGILSPEEFEVQKAAVLAG